MTPLDHLTAAFECLWETKMHLLKVEQAGDPEAKLRARAFHDEAAALRDRMGQALVELQGRIPPPKPPHSG